MGWLTRAWLATLRVRITIHEHLEPSDERPRVFCFFHGTQFPLLAWQRRRSTAVLVSHSRDGSIQAAALGVHGFAIVRGSSSKGGARGLASLVRAMKRGCDTAFAVDGPRGPYGVVKRGALVAARSVSAQLVPVGSASARAWIFGRAWDRFELPLPFSRVAIVVGAPLDATTAPEAVGAAIAETNAAALRQVNRTMSPCVECG